MRKKCVNKKKLFIIDSIIILALLLFDQFTKNLAVQKLMNKPAFVIIPKVLEFDYLENRGVAFGMFQNQKIVILISTMILLTCILLFMLKMPEGKKYTALHFVFSAIIAGGLGNMIDRLRLDYVIDFISFVLIDFPTFNVADCYIVCGTFILFFIIIFVMKEEDLEFISFKRSKEK